MSGYDGNLHGRLSNPPQGATSGYVSVTVAGDILRVAPVAPIQIVRWGFDAAVGVADATNALKLTGDVRPTMGSNTGRTTGATTTVSSQTGYNASSQPAFLTDTAGGSLTLTAAASQLAAGKGVSHEVNPQAGSGSPSLYPQPDTAFSAPGGVDTQLVIYPGQEFVIAVQATAPAAGSGSAWVEYRELANVGPGYAGLATVIPSSISPTPSAASSNRTRVQS